MLTEEQAIALILSLGESRGQEGFTEEEANTICEWATNVIVEQSLLDGVLSGHMLINLVDGEPTFGLSEEGKKRAEELIFAEGKLGPPNQIQ